MSRSKSPKIRKKSAFGLRLAAALLFLCLLLCWVGCSGEVYDPDDGVLTLEGDGGGVAATQPSTGNDEDSSQEPPTEDPFEGADHLLRADFLQTGKSDAILIQADGVVILVDAGESDDYDAISGALDARGITVIHHMILTHFDNDHIGSAAKILQNFTVEAVYMPDYRRDSVLYRRLTAALEGLLGTAVHRLTETATLPIPNGKVTIHPTALYEAGLTLGSDDSHDLEENNYSLVTEISFGDKHLLLAGDAERARIGEFMAGLGETCAYDLMKIPHHGGYNKALGELLRMTDGLRYCVVHVDDPSEVEVNLSAAMGSVGAQAFLTCNGSVSFVTDGVGMVVKQG